MKLFKTVSTCAAAVLMLQACAVLPGGGPDPLDTFDLSAAQVETRAGRTRMQILVAEPSALKALDGQNLVVRPSASSIEFLAGAQWADRLPRIVQARLAETLQATGRFGGVGKPGEGLAIDYQIATEIRSFEVRVDGAARAQVELYVKLLDDRNGTVRGARTFAATVPLSGSANADYVEALDGAFDAVQNDVTSWVVASL